MRIQLPRRPVSRRRKMLAGCVTFALVVLTIALEEKAPAAPRAGTTWYVSRHGDGTVGTSWKTAWTELSKINWSVINPGDRIVVDGGAKRCPSNYLLTASSPRPGQGCGMVYRTPLVIGASGSPGAPITIALSTARGHDGTALLFGGRSTPLPYCGQKRYSAVGSSRPAGITLPGRSHVVIDGSHRSGIMVYGAEVGVDLKSDRTSYVWLRNLELFDNGTYERWAHGYRSDGEGISLVGHNITIDRDVIHDNGQDAIQDRDTAVPVIWHQPMHDISVTNSWLYERRADPLYPGFGFNSGAQPIAAQDCTHVDGLQVWGGGLHQQRMTFRYDVFGPYLAQGVYPGDDQTASFDAVVVADSLFLNPLDHAIIGPGSSLDPSTPRGWQISNVTSYLTNRPAPGLSTHGKIDLSGTAHTVIDSVFLNGYCSCATVSGRHNVWWGGERVPGGRHVRPRFVSTVPTGRAPSYATLTQLNLTPRCGLCKGIGSPIHEVTDLLRRIDRLNEVQP